MSEVTALENRLKVVKEKDEATKDNAIEHKKAREITILDVDTAVAYINDRLDRNGLTWLSTGYVSLWDRINKADEAIIDVLPGEAVIEGVNYEELRLKNSEVPDRKDLLTCLEEARTTLNSDLKRSKQLSEQNQDTNLQQSNVLISLLRSKSEDIKGQIKSASPSDQKSGSGGKGAT